VCVWNATGFAVLHVLFALSACLHCFSSFQLFEKTTCISLTALGVGVLCLGCHIRYNLEGWGKVPICLCFFITPNAAVHSFHSWYTIPVMRLQYCDFRHTRSVVIVVQGENYNIPRKLLHCDVHTALQICNVVKMYIWCTYLYKIISVFC